MKNNDAASAMKKPGNEKKILITASYPDIIKAKGFLKGDMSYDYAHNPLPNRYYGQPQFALELFNDFKSAKNEEGLVFALSWRAHQVSDVFAHHAPLNGFRGYVNSVNFFGLFWQDALKHLGGKDWHELAGAFYRADHWIAELIIDLHCCLENGVEWSREMLRDSPSEFLSAISEQSRKYIEKYGDAFKSEYEEILPIDVSQIKRGKEFSDALNAATLRYFDSLLQKRSATTLAGMIKDHGKFKSLNATLDYVAWETARALSEPDKPWITPRIDGALFIEGNAGKEKVFPGDLTEDEKSACFSGELEDKSRNYKPKREGIVKFVLEKTPLPPVKWLILHTGLVTGKSLLNRLLLPKGKSAHAISLRYAFNIRQSGENNLLEILRKTLEETDIIDIST